MATHMINIQNETSGTSLDASLNATSSLRRKSLHIPSALPSVLTENNDEAERLARRQEYNAFAAIDDASKNNRRRSLGLSFLAQMTPLEINDRMSECIKLNTENKINIKNAFSLKIIDFMTYMIKKQDSNMSNLQVASTSLDVSTKIYGYRVDGIHTELMKMAGGFDKDEDGNPVNNENDSSNTQANEAIEQKHSKKKKNRYRHKIISTVDNLRGTVETMKPSIWIMDNEDTQTTDALFQIMLANHANSKYYLHLYNDVIVDNVDQKTNKKSKEVVVPKIEDFSELNMCPILANFEFQGWTSDNEKEEDNHMQPEEEERNEFQFDLDASLPSEDEVMHENINYLDVHDDVENEDIHVEAQKQIIVDMKKVVSNVAQNKTSEYSFLQKSNNMHWAGPSHWKISNFSKLLARSKLMEACPQTQVRKRKEIELSYDDNAKETMMKKFEGSKATRLNNALTEWCEEMLTLPRDMHYNIASAAKLYLHSLISVHVEKEDQLNATHIDDLIDNYDYDNENDTSNYCPDVPNDDYATNEDDRNNCNSGNEDGETGTQATFIGDDLVAIPKLVNKISITYSTRAKRIDMRQLKKSIWKSLTANNADTENIRTESQEEEENKMKENKHFSEIYKTLPNILTKVNTEALSFPISFVSLLHLANEKTLKIESLPDMSDLIVNTN